MAKPKAKNQAAEGPVVSEGVEPMVIALAEQVGSFLGRVQAKADGWLENDALREQVGQIRDGAANLLKRVNSASTAARNAVMKPAPKKKSKAKLTASASKGRRKQSLKKMMGGAKTGGQKQLKVGKSRGRR